MIEERRTDTAVPNSRTADLSILPFKGSKAGGAVGSLQPRWDTFGCFVLSPLSSVAVLLVGTGGKQHSDGTALSCCLEEVALSLIHI